MSIISLSLLALTSFVAADEQSKLHVLNKPQKAVPEDWTVVFCARGTSIKDKSVFGHAFIALVYNDEKKKACVQRAIGFFPEKEGDALPSAFGPVPGKVVEDFLRNKPASGTCRLIVRVDRPQYDTVEKVLTDWNKKDFQLVKNDCVSFVHAVAEALKLKMPDRRGLDQLPFRYVQKLTESNGKAEK